LERPDLADRERSPYVRDDMLDVGDFKLLQLQTEDFRTDTRELLPSNIREKLLGKTVKATGSIIQANKLLYFFRAEWRTGGRLCGRIFLERYALKSRT
jgi:hypothetical protein